MTMKEKAVPNQETEQELLIGEITAALVAESMSAKDALPAAFAARAIAARAIAARDTAARDTAARAESVRADSVPAGGSRRSFAMWSGWLAAAAILALWLRGPSGPAAVVTAVATTVASSSATASWVRDSLISVDSAITRIAWAPTADSSAMGASGDVVWSTRAQRGVMRLVGLRSNDVRRWQYQLWIFDKTRDQRYPVDGGVFDVPPGVTEVFVPINARVPVGSAVMFAVTVEAPGGVVVSTRERVALLAAL